ncbi:hypothetical protein OEW28_01210 [Defluviimonas sp. WL0002]|uniref:Inner membrane protein n=1 Tax=Albidovulum marisflavi TaxID=2984159 RepID=A0ABT2Z817_9RHOB|nr:hypothetical protein [Defluviimonas sp. WL0002]MCV2867243.1 hypothetical protein [Defluviimonas sp. WL0002]
MARKKSSETPDDAQAPIDTEAPEVAEPVADTSVADADVMPEATDEPVEQAPLGEDMPDEAPVATVDEAAERPARSGGGWFGTVLGGAVAAGIGAGAAYYVLPQLQPGGDMQGQLAVLKAQLGTQDADISALETRVGAMAPGASTEDMAALDDRVSSALAQAEAERIGFAEALSALTQRVDAFDERLTALERAPASGGGVSTAAIQSFEREIATLRAEIEGQRSESSAIESRVAQIAEEAESRLGAAEEEAARIRAQAEAEAKRSLARAALSHLRAAMESGAAIDGALADLASAGVEVPSELGEQAKGVPTSQLLLARFETASRDALSVSLRETAGDGWLDKITAFLRSQSGARSLTPRAGDDPDAVLSRAEAALRAGDIAGAIDEIGNLPAAGQAVMGEWIGLAQRRMTAQASLSALAQAVE